MALEKIRNLKRLLGHMVLEVLGIPLPAGAAVNATAVHVERSAHVIATFDEEKDVTITESFANNITMGEYNFGRLNITELEIDHDTELGTGKAVLGTITSSNTISATTAIPTADNIEAVLSATQTFDPIIVIHEKRGISKEYDAIVPNRIAGEIKITGFTHTDDSSTATNNVLYGVFVGEAGGREPKL